MFPHNALLFIKKKELLAQKLGKNKQITCFLVDYSPKTILEMAEYIITSFYGMNKYENLIVFIKKNLRSQAP